MKLERYPGNPILSPHPDHPWEDLAVFNPAAWYDEPRREVLLLYRAAEAGPEYKCWFGLALTQDFQHWIRAGWLTDPLLDDRDAILFPEKINGRYALIHRPLEWVGPPYGTDQACAWISFADDLLGFPAAPSNLLLKNEHPWETAKLGVNTPPIRTPYGWFTLYHAVGPDKFYRLGAVLLDFENPAIVRHRTPAWLMQPEADYEREGFYRGVCFPCGTVVIDGTLFVYYGGGDRVCAVATCDFTALLQHLRSCPGSRRHR